MKCSALLLALQLAHMPALSAQSRAHTIRWWHVALVAGGVGAASVFDRGMDAWVQDRRSPTSDRWARAFRNGGQPEVVFGVPGAMLAAGLISGRPGLERAGGRVLAAVLLRGGLTGGPKEGTGRVLPFETPDQYLFRPFSGKDAFPSGHATMAFALATSLGAEIHNRAVSALLYAGATGTAWSRLNDQRHWLSDVLAGAAVGLTSAKLIEGQWRVFWRPPAPLLRRARPR